MKISACQDVICYFDSESCVELKTLIIVIACDSSASKNNIVIHVSCCVDVIIYFDKLD